MNGNDVIFTSHIFKLRVLTIVTGFKQQIKLLREIPLNLMGVHCNSVHKLSVSTNEAGLRSKQIIGIDFDPGNGVPLTPCLYVWNPVHSSTIEIDIFAANVCNTNCKQVPVIHE